jgi:hypothetical protein
VKPESIGVDLRTFGNGLEAVEEVELGSASGSREDQTAGLVRLRLPRLQTLNEL